MGRKTLSVAALLVVAFALWVLLRDGEPGGRPDPAAREPGTDRPAAAAATPLPVPPDPGAPDPAASASASPPPAADRRTIEVLVLDAGGAPVPGAAVYLLPRDCPGVRDLEEARAPSGETDEEGRSSLPEPDGQRTLGVVAEGFLSSALPLEPFPAGEPRPPVEVRLDPGSIVAGRVVSAVDGSPVEEAEVDVWTEGDGREPTWEFPGMGGPPRDMQFAMTGPDGTFRLRGVAPGRHRIAVEVPGYREAKLLPHEGMVEAPVEGLEVVLQPMPVISLEVSPWEGASSLSLDLVRRGSGETVAGVAEGECGGRLRLGIPEGSGEYEARIRAPGRGWATVPLTVEPGESSLPLAVTLRAWPELRVLPPEGAALSGRIYVTGEGGGSLGDYPASGEEAILELLPGRYRVAYGSRDRVAAPRTVEVPDSGGASLVLDAPPATVLRVVAGRASGVRVDAAEGEETLFVFREGGEVFWGTEADVAAGDLVVLRPVPGAILRTSDPGFPPVTLKPGESATISFGK